MNRLTMILLLAGWGLAFSNHPQKTSAAKCVQADNLQFKEISTRQFDLTRSAATTIVGVYNLNGPIHIEGYAGSKVIVEADKIITARFSTGLETGKREVQLAFAQSGDSVLSYLAKPYDLRPHNSTRHHHFYDYDHDDQERDPKLNYNFRIAYVLKVPYDVNVSASTINDGDIRVANVSGTLKINNVNGGITLTHAKGATEAHTINGDLLADYLSVPPATSSYYALNGTLKVSYPANLSANIRLKSMNGEFFTDFPNAEALPDVVEKTRNSTGSATIFKLKKQTELRIGSGGKLFSMETLNGNIYIKKNP